MTTPVRTVSVNSARPGSSREARSASATMSAMAPVAWTVMKVVLVRKAAPTIP